MKRLLIIACTATKHTDPALMPALNRYDGPSFRVLRRQLVLHPGLDILVLSARFGLIGGETLIPDYNQRMTTLRATELRPSVRSAFEQHLQQHGPYTATLVHLGSDYLPAWADAPPAGAAETHEEQVRAYLNHAAGPPIGALSFTSDGNNGGIGYRLCYLRAWLEGATSYEQ